VIVGRPEPDGGGGLWSAALGKRNLILAAGLVLLVGIAGAVWQVAGRSSPRSPGAGSASSRQAGMTNNTSAPTGSPAPSVPAPVPATGSSQTTTPSTTRTSTGPQVHRSCSNPVFVTSDRNGLWSTRGYYLHNNMWNDSVSLGPETLYACAFNNWHVVSNQTNAAGAVKTFPNVHKDYSNVPISSFNSITSSFAATAPRTGIYNVAYDIWINGIAASGSTELMIWTENYRQVPAGGLTRTVSLNGRTYDVWKTSDNRYIAFVPKAVMTSASINLLEMMKWMVAQGWITANATLGQICYGVEIVSTNGKDETFAFTDFSITAT
jgi:hypothetical protein